MGEIPDHPAVSTPCFHCRGHGTLCENIVTKKWIPLPPKTCKIYTRSDTVNYSLPGSFVHGILQARILEWAAISYSRGSTQPRSNPGLPHCRQIPYHLSHVGNIAFPTYERISIQKDKDVGRSKINSGEWSPWKRGGQSAEKAGVLYQMQNK